MSNKQQNNSENRIYAAIDLKSYYASVECVDRNLDAMRTNLVVADASRTEKTICLAVSPSLKAYGIPGRARLFEVVSKVNEENTKRLARAPGNTFTGSSTDADELKADPSLKIDYIVAVPRMRKYMEISASIYEIYLKYVAPEDIHVYSIDECFLDITEYLNLYNLTPRELVRRIIGDIFSTTGITATGGIGTNLYLCKLAMDIVAKHVQADADGVRIAELDERSYRSRLWDHEPLTDFWRVGRGIASRLAQYQIFTMGDIARCSIGLPPLSRGSRGDGEIVLGSDGRVCNADYFYNEQLLYKQFGVNAELLIDHAWGYEPTTMQLIKEYRPESNSLGSGQVLSEPYSYDKAEVIVREMIEQLSLDLVDKKLVTDQIVLHVGYDRSNDSFAGERVADYYGRGVPKPANGSVNLGRFTSSTMLMMDKTLELFAKIVNSSLYVRRVSVTANHVISEEQGGEQNSFEQLSLFDNYEDADSRTESDRVDEATERSIQNALLSIKKKYGKNAILKGTDFRDGATARERNNQVGGHKG